MLPDEVVDAAAVRGFKGRLDDAQLSVVREDNKPE